MPWKTSEDAVFRVAFGIESEELRAEYLQQIGAMDSALRDRVASLLEASAEEPAFLEPVKEVSLATLGLESQVDRVGTQIGPYKLRELLGEGGMGVVYVAEQTAPVRRKVALKIVRPGMATKEVVARFEAERQALAMMDHPSIARVFDGGETEAGQPYFVMELVQGLPITEYCDEERLSTEERLRLFTQVCRAVQHAHQKGVIHRDLKPSNILVSEIDGKPVPKVIDFGVAKAIGQGLTEETLYTHFSQMVGTPLYMSPEQTGLGVVDVDTRSDVYSLGVLLYELLTGTTPFDSATLKAAGFDEMRRIIREEEPARPSAQVSTLAAEALSTIAERRKSDPRKLSTSLAGELDWLVMKALEKDRARRYQSAGDLAEDVERYLAGEAVEACPPSVFYLIAKFVQRNKAAAISAAAILVVLVLGIVGTSWQAWRAIEQTKRAKIEQRRAENAQQLAEDNAEQAEKSARASKMLVEHFLSKFDSSDSSDVTELNALSNTLVSASRYEDARAIYEEILATQRRLNGKNDLFTCGVMYNLASVLYLQEEYDSARELCEQALEIHKALLGPDHTETLLVTELLGQILYGLEEYEAASKLQEKVLETRKSVLGQRDELTLVSMVHLGRSLNRIRKFDGNDLHLEAGKIAYETRQWSALAFVGWSGIARVRSQRDACRMCFWRAIGAARDRNSLYIHAQQTFEMGLEELAGLLHDMELVDLRDEAASAIKARKALDEATTPLGVVSATIELEPWTRKPYRERALLHAAAESWDASAADWVRLIELSQDAPGEWQSQRIAACRELTAWPEVQRRVIELAPNETAIWVGSGQYHALRSDWTRAASDYSRAIPIRPIGDDTFQGVAAVLLADGEAEYERLCEEVKGRGEPSSPFDAYVLARLFAIGASKQIEPERMIEWAQRKELKWLPDYHVLGLCQFRAGLYEQAIENLEHANSLSNENLYKLQNWFVLAMAHFRLGNLKEAHEALEIAKDVIDREGPQEPGEPANVPAPDWIAAEVLRREAESVLSGIANVMEQHEESLSTSDAALRTPKVLRSYEAVAADSLPFPLVVIF